MIEKDIKEVLNSLKFQVRIELVKRKRMCEELLEDVNRIKLYKECNRDIMCI